MDDRRFLHDQERLLGAFHPSLGSLIVEMVIGFFESIVASAILLAIIIGATWASTGAVPALWIDIVVVVLIALGILYRRYSLWSHSSFRVTTERILLQHHSSLFSSHLTTVKWPQYQESEFGPLNPLDIIFRARTLCIRYGTADAHLKTCFPSLAYAKDLKHYLDKVDSAFRGGPQAIAQVQPFVMKPRGQRDS